MSGANGGKPLFPSNDAAEVTRQIASALRKPQQETGRAAPHAPCGPSASPSVRHHSAPRVHSAAYRGVPPA